MDEAGDDVEVLWVFRSAGVLVGGSGSWPRLPRGGNDWAIWASECVQDGPVMGFSVGLIRLGPAVYGLEAAPWPPTPLWEGGSEKEDALSRHGGLPGVGSRARREPVGSGGKVFRLSRTPHLGQRVTSHPVRARRASCQETGGEGGDDWGPRRHLAKSRAWGEA